MEAFEQFLTLFSHLDWLILFIPFLVLILCGLGLPLPEDILLVLMGFLVHNKHGNLTLALILGYMGIIIGDSIMFSMGKKYGLKLLNFKLFSKLITQARLEKAQKFILDHGKKTIFLARFLPGLRSAVFFSCGTLKLRFFTFFSIDSIAALLSAPVFTLLGYYFGDEIDLLITYVKRVDRVVIIVMIAVFLGVYIMKKYYTKRSGPASSDNAQK
jgi:membrane protein DedA with SNARE-associated domain